MCHRNVSTRPISGKAGWAGTEMREGHTTAHVGLRCWQQPQVCVLATPPRGRSLAVWPGVMPAGRGRGSRPSVERIELVRLRQLLLLLLLLVLLLLLLPLRRERGHWHCQRGALGGELLVSLQA